jgi:iron complex transport system substrate-binding protein
MKRLMNLMLPVCLLVLAGCVSAVTPAPTTNASPTAPAAEAAASGETRSVEHAMGTTQVPLNPQRVVVLDIGELDAALALGIKPVGSVTVFDDGLFPAYLEGQTDGIEVVGTIGSPNLEKILALQPDLILSNKSRDEAIYPLLSEIAPTVFAERLGMVWKGNFQLYAEALNKEAEGEAIIAAYDARLAQLREALGDPSSVEVSILRFIEGGTARVYQRGGFIGSILNDVGFARPASQQAEDEVWTEMSKELLPEIDADLIFYGVYGAAAESPEADYLSDPLWAQLSAVQAEQVYAVDDEYWFVGLGFNAANRALDDLFTYLVE